MNILRFYNRNRFTIWIGIIIIALAIIIIQFLNFQAKKENNNLNEENNIITNSNAYKNSININEQITNESVKEDTTLIIDQFIRLCNEGNIEKAYAILADECKQNVFPNIEYFKTNYYNKIFKSQKLYSKTNYIGNTYTVNIYDNVLTTGKYEESPIQDYYTIVNKNAETKLNISNYIGQVQINSEKNSEKLKFNIVKKNVYSDYEEYEVKIENLTYKTVLIDSKESTKTMYLLGNSGAKYYSYSHEILEDSLILSSRETKTIKIKYNKTYNSNSSKISKMVFSDIITDYEEYKNKEQNINKEKIEINI